MSRLYISQNNRDTELALLLAWRLQKRGHSVAVNTSFLVSGTEWMRSIRDETGACDGIILSLLMTRDTVGSSSSLHYRRCPLVSLT